MPIFYSEKKIKYDSFLPPYATVELAILCLEQKRLKQVRVYLEKAKYVLVNSLCTLYLSVIDYQSYVIDYQSGQNN